MKSRNLALRMLAGVLTVSAMTAPVGGVLLMSGCKKEEPPPPPPPPPLPPPPAPENVDMRSIAATLKLDPRVQLSDQLLTTSDSLAKAALELANALAKGDDKAFAAALDPAGKELVRDLVASEEWADSTKRIEGVRLVRLSAGGDAGFAMAAPTQSGIPEEGRQAVFDMVMGSLPQEAKDALRDQLGREPTAADLAAIIEPARQQFEQLKTEGKLPAPVAAQIEEQFKSFEELSKSSGAAAAPIADNSGGEGAHTLLLAIQQPGVAIAQSWIAVPVGDRWVFKASSAQLPPNQRRASDFDKLMGGAPAAAPASEGEAAPEAQPSTDGGETGGGKPTVTGG